MTLVVDPPVVDEIAERPSPSRVVRRSVGSWRLAARLARREVRRRWGRTLIIVLLIAVPVAAMAIGDIGYRSDRAPFDNRHSLGAADARLDFQELVEPKVGTDFRALVEPVLPAGTTAVWFRSAGLPLRRADTAGDLVYASVTDVKLDTPITQALVGSFDGRFPAATDEVWLSRRVAAQFGMGVGDRLELVHPAQSFTVVGVGHAADAGDGFVTVDINAPGFDFGALRFGPLESVLLSGEPWKTGPQVSARGVYAAAGLIDSTAGVDLAANPPPVAQLTVPMRYTRPVADGDLARGWLYGTLAMGVLGVIVAAAFAVSGRRQLVSVGQLSAQGATSTTIGRSLALQGTLTGIVGAGLGLLVGRLLFKAFASTPPQRLQPVVVNWRDMAVIAVTAITIATIAATVPSRSLSKVSVLTALGGRRPVPAVPRRTIPIGLATTAAGLATMVLTLVSDREHGGPGDGTHILTGALGAAATLGGVCLLCPMIIEAVARIVGRRPGTARMAARSLARHRVRSAALLASIIAIGAAATVLGTIAERNLDDSHRVPPGLPSNLVVLQSTPVVQGSEGLTATESAAIDPSADPSLADPEIEQRVKTAIPSAQWIPTQLALDADTYIAATYGAAGFNQGPVQPPYPADQFKLVDIATGRGLADSATVATDDLLDALQVDESARAALAEHGAIFLDSKYTWYTDPVTFQQFPVQPALRLPESPTMIDIPDVLPNRSFGRDFLLMTPETAAALSLDLVDGPVYVQNASPFTTAQRLTFYNPDLFVREVEANTFVGVVPLDRSLSVEQGYTANDARAARARLLVIAAALALVLLVVGFGLALSAVEGRDEQRVLHALGASPRTLALTTAWRSMILTFTGLALAMPLGYGTVWWISTTDAADTNAPFPGLVVGLSMIAIPIAVTAITAIAGAAAAHRHPSGRP